MKSGNRIAGMTRICARSLPMLLLAGLFVFTDCSKDPVATETPPAIRTLVGCVSYFDYVNQDLRFIEKTGDTWGTPEVLSSTNATGFYSSVALDGQGNPHISFYDATAMSLNYVVRTSEGWRTSIVDDDGIAGHRSSIALDANGIPHISYFRGPDGGPLNSVKHAWIDGGIWYTETIPSLVAPYGGLNPYDDWGHPVPIAVDADGNLHVCYQTVNGHLEYAVKTAGSGWAAESVDAIDNVGSGNWLVLDAAGTPHIAYFDYTHTLLKYAWKNGAVWDKETITTGAQPNVYTYPLSLALDTGGTPHISFWTINGTLGYLVKTAGGAWLYEEVDAPATVGVYSSINIDAGGNPHIAYWDYANRHLKYAVRTGGAWTVDTIDSQDGVGWYLSFALGYQ
jgi:hypothetical protein